MVGYESAGVLKSQRNEVEAEIENIRPQGHETTRRKEEALDVTGIGGAGITKTTTVTTSGLTDQGSIRIEGRGISIDTGVATGVENALRRCQMAVIGDNDTHTTGGSL